MDVTVRAPLLTAAFWRSRRSASLFSVYAMRMAAVFTLAVSTVGIRTSAVPCWVSYLGYLALLVAAGTTNGPSWYSRPVFCCSAW
jgi:hypothetical protein